jgi:hypothetical protein
MTLLKAGLAEAMDETMMNGQWDTTSDITLIVLLIVCAVYVILAIGIRIAFVYYCGKLLLNYLKKKEKMK